MRHRRLALRGGRPSALVVAAALVFVVLIQTASAGTTAEIDGATAAGLCTTSYPGTTGPDQLSPVSVGHAGDQRRRRPRHGDR